VMSHYFSNWFVALFGFRSQSGVLLTVTVSDRIDQKLPANIKMTALREMAMGLSQGLNRTRLNSEPRRPSFNDIRCHSHSQ
jgi:hypothetical protein